MEELSNAKFCDLPHGMTVLSKLRLKLIKHLGYDDSSKK